MSDFDRYDDKQREANEEERKDFLNFLNMLTMMSSAKKEDTNSHMAQFFYEKYRAFINVGFTEDQAFELLLTIINGITSKM